MVPIRLHRTPTTSANHSVHQEEAMNQIRSHLRVPEATTAKEVRSDQFPAVSAMKSMSLGKLLPTASLIRCVPDIEDGELLHGDDLMYRRRALAAKHEATTSAYEALQREAAFCDSVFSRCPQTSTPFLTDLHGDSTAKLEEKEGSQPPPLHFADRRPPPRLTYTQVPRGIDSYFKYCGACVFADLPRCQYCQASKLSNKHRLALPRLAGHLLSLQPQLTAKEMAHRLAKYARNDDFCEELNKKIGWEPTAQALCSSHLTERSILEEQSDEKTKLVEDLQRRLAAEQANEAKFVAKIGTLNKELDISRSNTTHLEAKSAELSALLNTAQLELERIRDESAAQIATTTYLREQLEEWQARESAKTPTDTAVQATPKAVDVETQFEGACETVGTQTAAHENLNSLDGTTGRQDRETESKADHRREMPPSTRALGNTAHGRRSSCLHSKLGVKKCANDRLVALQTVLEMIHEVMDKKVQNTQAALAAGREAEGLVEYVKIFWREKLGLRKLANKKVGEMIRAIKVYSKQHSRVFWFAVNLGVRTTKIDRDGVSEDVPWVPWIPASAFELLAKIFEGQSPGIHELLSNYKKDYCVVERSKVVNAIIGSAGVLDSAVRLNDPSTWKPTSLALMMAPTTICRLVDDVLSIPEIEALPEMPTAKRPQKSGISIDTVLDIVLSHQVRATMQHQKELTQAFHRFDDGEQGLDVDEFRELLAWALKPDGPGNLDVIELYAKIESLADATLLDNDNDKNINDSLTFPIVIMQQIYNCPLACAAHCRKWWTLDDHDRPVPAGAMPASFHFRRSALLQSTSPDDSGNEPVPRTEKFAPDPGQPPSPAGGDQQHQTGNVYNMRESDNKDA